MILLKVKSLELSYFLVQKRTMDRDVYILLFLKNQNKTWNSSSGSTSVFKLSYLTFHE